MISNVMKQCIFLLYDTYVFCDSFEQNYCIFGYLEYYKSYFEIVVGIAFNL